MQLTPINESNTGKWFRNLNRVSTPLVLCMITLVVASGMIYSLMLRDQLRFPDEHIYYNHAKNFVELGLFSFDGTRQTAAKAPGYSFIFAPVMLFTESVFPLRLLNYAAYAIALWLVYWLVRRNSMPIFGALAVALGAMFPVFFYTASTLYPQIIVATILLLIVFLAERRPKLTWGASILTGFLSGYLVLMVPTFLFLIVVFLGWRRVVCRDMLTHLLCVVLVAAFVNVPWLIRNYQVFDAFVFVTTDGGINLLLGNSENTTPNAGVNTDISQYTTYVSDNGLSEAEADRYYRLAALKWISTHRSEAIKLYLLKLVNHFNFRNELRTASESSAVRDLALGATYLPLLILFLLRVITLPVLRYSRFELLLIVMYLAWALIMAAFFTRVRYRLPLDFFLLMSVSLFLYQLAYRLVPVDWHLILVEHKTE